MSELQEERTEAVNDALDKLRKLGQKWDDRPTLDNLRLSERYGVGEFEVIVHLQRRAAVPREAVKLCAVLKNRDAPESGGRLRFGDVGEVSLHEFPEAGNLIEQRTAAALNCATE